LKAKPSILAGLAGAALLIALGMVASFWAFRQIEDAAAARHESFLVLNGANGLMLALKDAETGQRGYLLTDDKGFMEPYLVVQAGIGSQLDELRRLTSMAAARKHLDAMAPLIEEMLAYIGHAIELHRKQDGAAVKALVASSEGKRLMDAIRTEMSGFISLEEGELKRRDADFESKMRYLLTLIVGASLAVMLSAMAFAYLVYQLSQQRLKDVLHLETQRLLDLQEKTNQQLQQTNANLRESEEKLAVTLNSIGDAVIATDADARVTRLNPVAEHLTGWSQAEAMGRPAAEIFNIINQETRQPATIPVMETLARGTTQGMANHTLMIARDGSERAIADSCAPIRDRDDKVVGAVLVFRDVTSEYAAQQALRDSSALIQAKNAELESAKLVADKSNLAKSDFLSSMSHELRTPLSAILGFAQLIDSGTPQPTLIQKRSIDQILKAGWYLLELINEVLDLATIESGKLALSLEPVALSDVLHECETMIEPQAQKHGISVNFSRLERPGFVRADRTRLKQALINLLSNAIKYNKPGGTIAVDVTQRPPDSIRISVRDTGAGLTPEQLTQLFQPFNRLGQKSNGEEGTGIGLVVSKRLIELMNGVIGVESSVGKGSVFWIELKQAAAPKAADPVAQAQVIAAPTEGAAQLHTLLYVEDNPANLMLVEDIIVRRPDIRLLTAVDGDLGIEYARAYQPEVILMDINLPGLSGIDAMRILHADPATAHIPIIALSANAMPGDIERGLKAGFFRYLTKPIKVNQFMETLDIALQFAHTESAAAAKREHVS